MPRRHDHLFGRIANFRALHAAARRGVKGKRRKPGAASFFANLHKQVLAPECLGEPIVQPTGRAD
jgi:hypothetical protein